MKRQTPLLALLLPLFLLPALRGAVPELEALVPSATGYETIYKFNPLRWQAAGYAVDNGAAFEGKLTRIGYLLKLTKKDGTQQWVFAEMEPFTQDLEKCGVPDSYSGVVQQIVEKLEVHSNVPGVETGAFPQGNIEFWACDYHPANTAKVPGAQDGLYDCGDMPTKQGSYGSMQLHNFEKRQTIFAFNRFNRPDCEMGIGNNPAPNGHADWTFAQNLAAYKDGECLVVGKFEGLKKVAAAKVNPRLVQVTTRAGKADPDYQPGEPMEFLFTIDFGKQEPPARPWKIVWRRSGDDGETARGEEEIAPEKPVKVVTSTKQAGFVRLEAWLYDNKGRKMPAFFTNPKNPKDVRRQEKVFEGGAGVQIYTLRQAQPEPDDFDAFWARQHGRLAAVPLKYTMEEILPPPSPAVRQFAVSVDCAGPRPVTGYLTIPVDAKPKSLPALVTYDGYSAEPKHHQRPMTSGGDKTRIVFRVNAHGYELGRDQKYYQEFYQSIKSNNQIYAFDPKQNSDPEKAYFNGMALRIMRSLEFVKALPEWDGKNLQASGGSQGGLQTFWAAGLDKDVTLATPGIPWCADLAGYTIEPRRLRGWRPDYVRGLDYYDIVNHAKRIAPSCHVNITRAGLGDYVCPPSGVVAAYNAIPGSKEIHFYQGSTHGFVPFDSQIFTVKGDGAKKQP